jgi:hypothetical protein
MTTRQVDRNQCWATPGDKPVIIGAEPDVTIARQAYVAQLDATSGAREGIPVLRLRRPQVEGDGKDRIDEQQQNPKEPG